jgi:Mn-dependent DtxR family transcriptional regulator
MAKNPSQPSALLSPRLSFGDALSVDLREYAVQGNAVLGIRDSGKSYTATYIAERLMDAGVPIVAFDPAGIWRWLRVAGAGPGYPVVVAGGDKPDLPLTPDGAPEIVRAAMREGVSIVLDLYSMKLSKADWHRIVERSVRVLLYENKNYGLRHIFLEEAAEFVPQVLNRGETGQARAYAEIEKLARMGGNAQLGYTLISQRAEQVNKAVLELCDMLLLHRQKGRLSLGALTKWLSIADARGAAEIVSSLATLPQGDCWAWAAGSDTPVRAHIPAKRTYHPDRRALHDPKPIHHPVANVSKFVEVMTASLEKIVAEASANDPARLKRRIAELERALAKAGPDPAASAAEIEEAERRGARRGFKAATEALAKYRGALTQQAAELAANIEDVFAQAAMVPGKELEKLPKLRPQPVDSAPAGLSIVERPRNRPRNSADGAANGPSPPPAQLRILNALAELEAIGVASVERTQLAFFADQSPRSSGYTNNLGALRTAGHIDYPSSGLVQLTEKGRAIAEPISAPPDTAALHQRIQAQIPPALWRILAVAIDHHPHALSRDSLAVLAGQSPTSSGYTNNLGRLRSLGLIDYPQPRQVVATPVLFIEGSPKGMQHGRL